MQSNRTALRLFRSPTFRREYQQLPEDVRSRAEKAIRLLLEDPRHPSLQAKKMHGSKGRWEARVSLSHRITYQKDGDSIILRRIGTHDILKKESS